MALYCSCCMGADIGGCGRAWDWFRGGSASSSSSRAMERPWDGILEESDDEPESAFAMV